ncbi:MAG: recombinase family protein [Pseudomonadota bacterium]
MKKPPKIRCAIYTRKSHEEGLDQEFNSLDAQRIAAEAYIQSQMHEGWEVVATRYDDGGFSGGTIERPALQRLLDDIKEEKVDVIVVYKVDRLSRSLMDFSKLVEIFDANNVSFVSVTQAFNTTNSMGRLTLNILLSFAQFEREVTGERIRDKFAASKKKGMWMGGIIPLGYDVQHRKLLVNPAEAEQVRFIFKKYLELKSIHLLKEYLHQHGYKPKSWVTQSGNVRGAAKHSKQSVRTLLSNYLYLGKIRHKEHIHDGEHEAIIDKDLWSQVQAQLQNNSVLRTAAKNQNHEILFKGKVADASGNPFITTYTKRGSKRYHYYLNKTSKARIGIAELNSIITNGTASLDINRIKLEVLQLSKAEICTRYHAAVDAIVREAVDKIVVFEDKITIMIDKVKLSKIIAGSKNYGVSDKAAIESAHVEVLDKTDMIEVILSITFRSYGGRKIGYSANHGAIGINKTNHDQSLIRAIVRSYKWNKMLESGEIKSVKEIAEKERVERTYAGDVMRLKYLSPEITTMIMNGTQPRNLNVSQLVRQPLPMDWEAQKTLLQIA